MRGGLNPDGRPILAQMRNQKANAGGVTWQNDSTSLLLRASSGVMPSGRPVCNFELETTGGCREVCLG